MAPPRIPGQLTVDDWVQAGYALLTDEGVHALKIDNLCRRLAVTKGSFYWHFEDIKAYKAALIKSWGNWQNDTRREMAKLDKHPPRERLEAMITYLTSPVQWTLERTMREWARSDPAVMASVRASDNRVRKALRAAFKESGFDEKAATRRAEWMLAIGVGALHLSNSAKGARGSAAERAYLVDFLLQPEAPNLARASRP